MASSFRNEHFVTVAVLGDGAMNQGSVHEALNFAAILHAPVIFLVDNNGFAEMTPSDSMTKEPELYRRAEGYGIHGSRIDGSDPIAVYRAMTECVARARQGNGPALLEAKTERLVGHYIGDVQHYRSEDDRERALLHDPIRRSVNTLVASGINIVELQERAKAIEDEVSRAAAEALSAPLADPAKLEEYVVADR
jgi:pyruvate dehydrogenase E1 component alpha subunit